MAGGVETGLGPRYPKEHLYNNVPALPLSPSLAEAKLVMTREGAFCIVAPLLWKSLPQGGPPGSILMHL